MSRKTRAFDWRSKYTCFICEKELKKSDKKFLVAVDGYHRPINLYIHKGCNDKQKIKAKVKKLYVDD